MYKIPNSAMQSLAVIIISTDLRIRMTLAIILLCPIQGNVQL